MKSVSLNHLSISPLSEGKSLRKIAIIGNHLPRKCGIATFTTHLADALTVANREMVVDVIAIEDGAPCTYPERVVRTISRDDLDAYSETAKFLNEQRYDVVCLQHEYGIFGGEEGAHVLSLLRKLDMPVVTTMHTVLREPNLRQRLLTKELLQLSERTVVMSQGGLELLKSVYGVDDCQALFIPHGVPDFGGAAVASVLKDNLGIEKMILTFGLLSPDKGIQYVIEAMPTVVSKHPNAVYVVLGATHPNIRANSGEAYRESLTALAYDLGVGENVRFIDTFVSEEELTDYLVAADIYVTPYLNVQQATSGTLSYALGAGKPIISTPYVYAEELLANDRGILTPFRDSESIADAITRLWDDDAFRTQIQQNAKAYAKGSKWSEIGREYCSTFGRVVHSGIAEILDFPTRSPIRRQFWMPNLCLDHLRAMTDDTGMLQHATYAVPNREEGYCLDDNARALLFTALMETDGRIAGSLRDLQVRYLSFVQSAMATGKSRNFMNYDRRWWSEVGSDDSHGRAIWCLGAFVNRTRHAGLGRPALSVLERALPALPTLTSPRAWAYAILGLEEVLCILPTHEAADKALRECAHRLGHLYANCRSEDWKWFEERVTYANARLSQALILAGMRMGQSVLTEAGLESLNWLMQFQQAPTGCFAPVGSDGFAEKGGHKAAFDQQPLEAWASVSACLTAHAVTQDPCWFQEAKNAFGWFLGDNQHGLAVYDESTGGCRDGLTETGVNENQGAESSLSFLCARAEMKAALRARSLPGVVNL